MRGGVPAFPIPASGGRCAAAHTFACVYVCSVRELVEEVTRTDLGRKIKEGVEEVTRTVLHSAESVSRVRVSRG